MAKAASVLWKGQSWHVDWTIETWTGLGKNNLWKRILKNVVATTLLVSICLIPGSKNAIGSAAYLGAITTVFGHPGRRFGQMAEALILVLAGTVLGVTWSTLGVYLASLVIEDCPPAAYAIRGLFLAFVVLIHGFLRSRTPRLFILVLLMIIVSVVILTSTAKKATANLVTPILYPILLAAGCIIFINLSIYPEFSSRFLGQTTIDTLNHTAKALEMAGKYFVEADTASNKLETPFDGSSEEFDHANPYRTPRVRAQRDTVSLLSSLYGKFLSPFRAGQISGEKSKNNASKVEKVHSSKQSSIKSLTDSKVQIRKKLAACKAAQQECNFELAFSVLPPRELKPISISAMKRLAANTIAVIGACESKFALLGDKEDSEETGRSETKRESDWDEKDNEPDPQANTKQEKHSRNPDRTDEELSAIKPRREIESGDPRLLRYLMHRVAKPYKNLHHVGARSIEVVIACIAHTYDVPALPSGAQVPKGIIIEELDVHMNGLQEALVQFDLDAASALEGAAALEELSGLKPDIMPREEIFLLSSFMLNVRQAVTSVEAMLNHSRELILRRQLRHGSRRLYAPRIKWSKWLYTGDTEDEAMPAPSRKANREDKSKKDDEDDDDDDDVGSQDDKRPLVQKRSQEDVEKVASLGDVKFVAKGTTTESHASIPTDSGRQRVALSPFMRFRHSAADILEWVQGSEDVLYAMKLEVAIFLVLWPAFIASWNRWYSLNRGLWAALQLVLITEVSIGTSVMTFILRAIGTSIGCLWGYAAVEARNGNRIVCAAMICISLFPCAYVQLDTKYPKAGMVCIVSICVVALSSELETVPGTPTENFLKRWIAFLIGGVVALLIEIVLFPVKARTRLTDSLAAALRQINDMERCIAYGIESAKEIDIHSPALLLRFEHASSKAKTALSAAETFLPFCSTEPRIKGSFQASAIIYGEILYVMHQIVDRMDNMLQLRTAYGSGPLEELNADIYPYRRNVAGSITLTLFAIHSSLTTKLPLPQYLPSARLAHLRMINRVREVVLRTVGSGHEDQDQDVIARLARQRAVRGKYLSWNAASAAQAEIIEYLEELIELTKLLVGANEFRSGLLMRPSHNKDHVEVEGEKAEDDKGKGDDLAEVGDEVRNAVNTERVATRRRRGTTQSTNPPTANRIRRRRTIASSPKSNEDDVPVSLRRIQSRKMEAGLKKQRTNESQNAPLSSSLSGKAKSREP